MERSMFIPGIDIITEFTNGRQEKTVHCASQLFVKPG